MREVAHVSISSQKVGDDLADGNGTGRLSCGVERREVPVQVISNIENGRDITASVAVVGS